MAGNKALGRTAVLMLVLFALGSAIAPVLAQTTTITVQTDTSSYSGTASVKVSGVVTPAPTTPTGVIVTVLNPNGTTVDVQNDPVSLTTGAYNGTTVTGGTASWVAGTYTVNATWGGNGETAKMTTTFVYNPSTSSTSSSSSSSSSSSTSTSTSSSTTSSSTTSSTTTSSITSSTTSSTTTPPSTSNVSTTTTTSSSSSTSGGSNTGLYLGIAAVVIIVVVLGVFMLRRRTAKSG